MSFAGLVRAIVITAFIWISAAILFVGCNSTSPEDKFQIEADSSWLSFDRLVIFRDNKSGHPDTLFDGKLLSKDGLSALPVGDYDGGKVTFTIQGFNNDQLVLNQLRNYDGAKNITQVTTTVDFSSPPASVSLSVDTIKAKLGAQSEIFSAAILPTKAPQKLLWKTQGTASYLVFQNGDSGISVRAYGESVGMSRVIAQAKNDTTKADTAIVIVTDTVASGSVTLDPDTVRIAENGASYSLRVTVLPTGAKVTFASRDSLVATVDSEGKVTAQRAGTTVIAVTSEAGQSDSSIVEVLTVNIIPSVTLLPDSIQLKENGQAFRLQPHVVPVGAKVNFVSRDSSVATVDSMGRVRSRKLGKTYVVAFTEAGERDSSIVEVIQEIVPLGSVRMSPDSIRLKEGGKKDSLQIIRSTDLASAKVSFQSRDTMVIQVDSLGGFRTVKPGKTWIVAFIAGGEPDSSLIDVFANANPVIESFSPNTTVSIRDTVNFQLNAQDADGVIRTVVWRLGKDTSVVVRDTLEKSMVQKSRSQAYPDTGLFWARITVTDENGGSTRDSVSVRVILDPPVVYAGRDTAAKSGESLAFTGMATQTFGRVVMWKWDFDGNGSWDDSSTSTPNLSHAYFKDARYSAILYARDDDGNVATDIRLVDISSSSLVLFGLSPRDTVISIKDSIPFWAQSASSDGQVRLISWDYDGDGAQDDTLSVNETSLTFRGGHRYNLAGVYKLALKVTDNSGRTVKDSARITVKQDPPKALAGADTLVFTGTKITLHAKGMDSLGVIVKKEWSIAGANFVTASQQDTAFTAPNSVSVLSCILRVTDDDGFSSLDTALITVALHREARLDGLSISAGKLFPAFHSDSLVYRDTVGLSVASIRLSATLHDVTANMKLKDKVLISGTPSDTLILNMGLNSFQFAIVAADTSYKKTYTVNVMKVDDVPPSAPVVSVQDTSAAAVLGRPIWTWVSGGGGVNAGYRYKLNDPVMTSGATATALTTYQPDSLKIGYHTLYVQEKDSANNWSPRASAPVWVGPISWYKLDNNGVDSGLNAAPLKITDGMVFSADRKGAKFSALEFSGKGESALVSSPKVAAGSSFTFSFWFLNPGTHASSISFAATPGNEIFFAMKMTTLEFGVSAPTASSVSGTWVANQWTHAAGVYNGKTVQLYVNGKIAGSLALPGTITGDLTDLLFGGSVETPWSGALDDIRIYKRALTAAEVAKIFAQ